MSDESDEMQELSDEIDRLPPKRKREFYMKYFAYIVSIATRRQIAGIRDLVADEKMKYTVGPVWRQRILNMIDGHLALRDMGLVRKKRNPDAPKKRKK